jgi:hypothetical protein
MVWDFHHMLMDGWCMGIIAADFVQIYRSLKYHISLELPPVYTYGEYIEWLGRQDKEGAESFWKGYLGDYVGQAVLPGAERAAAVAGYRLEEKVFSLGEELTSKLSRIGNENNVTLNTVFQALWGILLCKYNNTEDVVFGAVVSGRPAEIPGIETAVGLFINTIPVRIKTDDVEDFESLIKEVQQKGLEAEKYSYFPLNEVKKYSESKDGLINHILVFENYPLQQAVENSGKGQDLGFEIRNADVFEQTNYDLNVLILPGKDLAVKLAYNANVYAQETLEGIERHFKNIAEEVADDVCSVKKY